MNKHVLYYLYLTVCFLSGYFTRTIVQNTIDWNNYWNNQLAVVKNIDLTPRKIQAEEEFVPIPDTVPETTDWDDIATIYAKFRKKESSNGTAGIALKCKAKGESWINEIGWSPSTGFCFVDEAMQFRAVVGWVNSHKNEHGLTMAQALCHYALGGKHGEYDDCEYFREYLLIKI